MLRLMRAFLFLLLLIAPASSLTAADPATADPAAADYLGKVIIARAVAIDGDSLLITGDAHAAGGRLPDIVKPGETRLRLWGVIAPNLDKPGGWAALGALDAMLEETDNVVQCRLMAKPENTKQTLVARCSEAGGDFRHFSERLVADGWAVAFRHYTWMHSADHATALELDRLQAVARREKRGRWGLLLALP